MWNERPGRMGLDFRVFDSLCRTHGGGTAPSVHSASVELTPANSPAQQKKTNNLSIVPVLFQTITAGRARRPLASPPPPPPRLPPRRRVPTRARPAACSAAALRLHRPWCFKRQFGATGASLLAWRSCALTRAVRGMPVRPGPRRTARMCGRALKSRARLSEVDISHNTLIGLSVTATICELTAIVTGATLTPSPEAGVMAALPQARGRRSCPAVRPKR